MSSLRTPEMRLLFAGYPSPKQPLYSQLPPGGLFISSSFEWVGGGGGLIKLEKTVVSVLHKELEYKVEKLKYKKVGDHAAEDHWESNPTFQVVNKPSRISPQEVLPSWLIIISEE